MILQALYDYYERKSRDRDSGLAEFGFEWKELPFIIEIDEKGEVVQIEDTREGEGRRKRARAFLVPQGIKKTSGIAANLLWDNAEYLLGVQTAKGKPERIAKQHEAFVEKIATLPESVRRDCGVQAVLTFLEKPDWKVLEQSLVWEEILLTNPMMTFRIQGDMELVCQRPAVVEWLREELAQRNIDGRCLITGEPAQIERLHTSIKGVWGAQTSGANIVSFNLDAFTSYGKSQGYNAPVGRCSAFAYTTALNHLLRKGSPQRIQVGDASTVFWAQRETALETGFAEMFGEPPKDDPDRNVRAVASLYRSIEHGLLSSDEGNTRFYVLGLAPNASRIAIRFWEATTVAGLAGRIRQHFDDLAIVHSDRDPPYLPLFRLLVSIAAQGKADNIPPNLAGETMRSILTGLPYPQALLAAAVRRNRAERSVGYRRAALIKACLNRQARFHSSDSKEEITVSLDKDNRNPGYRLGRLFAVLEKIQEEAVNPKATIRDRYYGAASATPVSVFSTLLKLKNHHLGKLENRGRVVNFERLLGEIMDGISDFPPVLSLSDQGRFAIGYYHQRQDFFNKTTASETEGEKE